MRFDVPQERLEFPQMRLVMDRTSRICNGRFCRRLVSQHAIIELQRIQGRPAGARGFPRLLQRPAVGEAGFCGGYELQEDRLPLLLGHAAGAFEGWADVVGVGDALGVGA